MKRFLAWLLVIVSVIACNKSSTVGKEGAPAEITGKWKLSETYSSNGSVGQWSPVPVGSQYTITFNADYSLVYSNTFEYKDSGYNRYTFSPNRLVYTSSNNARVDSFAISEISSTTLRIYSLQRICIEGCAQKFVRVN